MILAAADELPPAQAFTGEAVTLVELQGARVAREDAERDLLDSLGARPRHGGLEQRAAHPDVAAVARHRHPEDAHVRRRRVRVGDEAEVTYHALADEGREKEAGVVRRGGADAPPPFAGADLAGPQEERDLGFGRDGVEQPRQRPGVARAR